MIEEWFGRHGGAYESIFIRDPAPLGTGGALARAMTAVRSNPVLVLNGDSLCELDPERLLRFHALKRACATITVTHREERQDTGAVMLGEDDRVLSMIEKPRTRGTGYDNAGMYVFDQAVEPLFPAHCPWSLERDLLPRLTTQGFYGFVTSSPLYDIGTPERLARFRDVRQETPASLSVLPVHLEQGSIS